jgi:hypothetical protein
MGYFKNLDAEGVTDLHSFNVGAENGVFDSLSLLKAEIQAVSEPMMVDKEYLDGLERAVEVLEALLVIKRQVTQPTLF